MADIFLSYAREDLERARSLAEALTSEGWDVFWDRRIPPGGKFEDYIAAQVQGCRVMVVLWSPAATASEWVKIEAAVGRDRRILIPALIATTDLPFGYGHINAADLRAWRPGSLGPEFKEFVSAIETLAPHGPTYAIAPSVPPPSRPSGKSIQKLVTGIRELLGQSSDSTAQNRPGAQPLVKRRDRFWFTVMAAGVFFAIYAVAPSFLENSTIAQWVMWTVGGGVLVWALRSPAALEIAGRSRRFQTVAVVLVTVPWLFVIDVVTVRPALAPSNVHFRLSVDGQPKSLPFFQTRVRNSTVVLSGEQQQFEFRLSTFDLFSTLFHIGSKWRVLEPNWRLIYSLDIDCFGCPVPSTVTFTLDGTVDNDKASSPTVEGREIAIVDSTRIPVTLHAGRYTVTMTVNGARCAAPLDTLTIPYGKSSYVVHAENCTSVVRS